MKANKKATTTAVVIKNVAEKMAKISYGTASGWGMYQPKQPKKAK